MGLFDRCRVLATATLESASASTDDGVFPDRGRMVPELHALFNDSNEKPGCKEGEVWRPALDFGRMVF